jgi:hypothetical protein
MSLSNVAILAQFGIEGILIERLNDHYLDEGSIPIILKARSSNNIVYGIIPALFKYQNNDGVKALVVDQFS